MYKKQKSLLLSLVILLFQISLLTSCATAEKFDTSKVDRALTPKSVVAEADISRGKIALWGGTILDTRNLNDKTQIEVLAYPLNSSHRPLLDKKPLGRFIIHHNSYVEPTIYSQGRQLTVLGSVSDIKKGSVGESKYIYPVISAEKLYLWSKDDDRSDTRFHFGIGIGIHR